MHPAGMDWFAEATLGVSTNASRSIGHVKPHIVCLPASPMAGGDGAVRRWSGMFSMTPQISPRTAFAAPCDGSALAQYAGGLHGLHDPRREVVIYDYVDHDVPCSPVWRPNARRAIRRLAIRSPRVRDCSMDSLGFAALEHADGARVDTPPEICI